MARAMTRPKPIGRLLSYKDLHEVGVSFSRNYLRKLINDGKFPQPIRVGPCTLAWDKAVIRAWVEERPTTNQMTTAERAQKTEKARAAFVRNARRRKTQRQRGINPMPTPDIIPLYPATEMTAEERARRLTAEVERLARMPEVEWLYYVRKTRSRPVRHHRRHPSRR